MLPRFAAVLAVAATLAAAGCSAGVGGAWPGEPGDEPERCVLDADCAPGVGCGEGGVCALLVHVECVEAGDCPHPNCRFAPECMSGMCVAAVDPGPGTCPTGVCSAGACVPCVDDADCQANGHDECWDLKCEPSGVCSPHQKSAGDECNHTPGGSCDVSAYCR